MMQGLVDNAGEFRRGSVGVFKEDKAIHIAPPAERVPSLIEILKTLKSSQSTSNTTQLGVVNPKVAELLKYIKTHEGLNSTQLSKAINIAPRTLSRYLQSLSDSIEYIGSPRKGGYFLKR